MAPGVPHGPTGLHPQRLHLLPHRPLRLLAVGGDRLGRMAGRSGQRPTVPGSVRGRRGLAARAATVLRHRVGQRLRPAALHHVRVRAEDRQVRRIHILCTEFPNGIFPKSQL